MMGIFNSKGFTSFRSTLSSYFTFGNGCVHTDGAFLWGNALVPVGLISSLAAFYLGHLLLGLISAGAIFICWQCKTDKETVFKSSYFKCPTYRIPALVYLDNHFLAFCEKRLTGSKDYGPMNMVLKMGSLNDDDEVTWGQETTLYPEAGREDTTKRRPMNAVPIVVDKDHLILMFNTYPEDMPQRDVTNSDVRVWQLVMMHSYDGGKTWETSQELPVDKIFEGFDDSDVPSYCAVGPGHAVKLESSGRLVVSGNVSWPACKKKKNKPFAIVSDDDGATWRMGGLIPLPIYEGKQVSGNECQPVDMGTSNVVVNCRTPSTYPRIQCYSDDGCDTFTHSELMQTLIEPRNGCQGSTLAFKEPSMGDDMMPWAIFCNPDSRTSRKNLSVRISKDGCKTWSEPVKVLEYFGSGYSDLTCFTQDNVQKFACLFERNKIILRNIEFVVFTIDD